MVALLLRQDSERNEKWSKGLRIFLLLFSVSTFVITIGYQGALFSCLAIPVRPAPIGMVVPSNVGYPLKFNYFHSIPPLDTIEELAVSSLLIETRLKSGMGLDRGLSPIYNMLVDKYIEIHDGLDESLTRLGQNKIARHRYFSYLRIKKNNSITFASGLMT